MGTIMPTVYVLVGVPGAGKSTWIRNQDWARDCVVVSTDAFVDQEAERQGKTYNEVFKDYMPTAVKLMADQVVQAREAGQDIIWDQTSTTVASRKKKFNMLPNYHAVAVVFPTPEPAELELRLAGRPGKNIPWNVMQGMISGLKLPTEDEGFDEIWYAD
jgi:predicted kinase